MGGLKYDSALGRVQTKSKGKVLRVLHQNAMEALVVVQVTLHTFFTSALYLE
jgi:hypothetical protein